jgi:hypothetical protein
MTEAAEAVTNYGFDILKFPVLRVPKTAHNVASRRISEKQGMRVVATEGARLCIRPIRHGNPGNHRRGMAITVSGREIRRVT